MVIRTGDKVINVELFLVIMKLIRDMMRHGSIVRCFPTIYNFIYGQVYTVS